MWFVICVRENIYSMVKDDFIWIFQFLITVIYLSFLLLWSVEQIKGYFYEVRSSVYLYYKLKVVWCVTHGIISMVIKDRYIQESVWYNLINCTWISAIITVDSIAFKRRLFVFI